MHTTSPFTETLIDNPPNTLDPIEYIYAFISQDEHGKEAVCGAWVNRQLLPLVTGSRALLDRLFKPLASEMRAGMGKTGKTVHLYRYTHRTELPW